MRFPFTQLLVTIVVCLTFSGCQTGSQGRDIVREPRESAPELATIVDSLRANDAALRNFRAAGTLTLESPKLKSIQRFPSGTVAYRRPSDLFVVGRNALGATLFKMTSRGTEFLIEFPGVSDTDERYYYSFEGEQFADVPFSVSPADVAREMFMPVDWSEISEKSARLRDFDAESGDAILEFELPNGFRRELWVHGAPWVVSKHILRDNEGTAISEVSMGDFTENNGVRFPARSEAWFPLERTRLAFELRNIRINTELDEGLFIITWRPGQ